MEPLEDNQFMWEAILFGPADSPFENLKFKLTIDMEEDYPQKPPKIRFKTRMYHPNINNNGTVCLDMLKNNWNPSFTIPQVLTALSWLLVNPNPDDPLSPGIAAQYKDDREAYNASARKFAKKFSGEQAAQQR